jgi:phenylpropionate dioxygenase-like ring-hydroxylating dioxygenase large terminal subunit
MWIKNAWYVAGFSHEVGQKPLARRLLNEPVLMYRLGDGQAAALQDRCPHRLVPLSKGERVGDEIRCGYHGLRFASDGRCTHIPGQAFIPQNARAVSYPLLERNGLLWIWLGDSQLADPTLASDFPWMNSANWRQSPGYHRFACDYRLMTDNLLDLSHETYVHHHTIGNQDSQSIADFPLKVTVENGSIIRAHREMKGIEPPPFFAMILGTNKPIDRWQTATYLPPGTNMTEAGVHPQGSARSSACVIRVMHLLTPETATSTHYFWSVVRNFHLDDTSMSDAVAKATAATFDEDQVILEYQQKALLDGDEPIPRFATKLDEAPLRARRMLERVLDQAAADLHYRAPVYPLVPRSALDTPFV